MRILLEFAEAKRGKRVNSMNVHSKNLHIVIYSELMPYGGGRETWLAYFIESMQQEFKSIKVYALNAKKKNAENLLKSFRKNVMGYYAEEIAVDVFLKNTKQYIKKEAKPGDVCLMIGSVVEGAISPWLKRNYGSQIKRIIWIRSIAAREISERHKMFPYPVIEILEKRNLETADKVVTNGEDTYAYYLNKRKVKKSKICCIPNAVYVNKFSNNRDWDENDIFTMAFIGRLTYIKGATILQQIANDFSNRYTNLARKCVINVWGEGHINTQLTGLLNYCGPAQRDRIPEILANSVIELFFIPADSKGAGGLSHSLLEGLASGCICLCSDVPAYRQVINDSNGVLVDTTNITATVDTLAQIVQDYFAHDIKRLKEMSESAVKTAQCYSTEKHAERFLAVLGGIT